MNGHHLILGKTKDFLSGETIEDNHDERYRQKIAEILVTKKGYEKSDIQKNKLISIKINNTAVDIPVDFSIFLNNKILMIIRYAPGSIVSREKPSIACARLMAKHEIPLCVVTNGEDAVVIDVFSGKTISKGIDSIPSKKELLKVQIKRENTEKMMDQAKKILFAFDVNDRCPCDDTICIRKNE